MNSSDVIVMGPGSGTVTPEMEAACGVLTAAPDGAAIRCEVSTIASELSQAVEEISEKKEMKAASSSDISMEFLINPPLDTVDTFQKKMCWLACLEAAERRLEADIKAVKKKIDELEPYVLEQFAENGVQNMNIGGFTFYTQPEIWVNKLPEKEGVTTEMVCDALTEAGLGYMVKDGYSASSLTAKVKEWITEAEEAKTEFQLHPALKKVLKIGKGVKLVARKA